MSKWDDPDFQKEYDRQRYQKNKEKRQAQNRARQDSIKKAIDDHKASTGCCKCSEKEPCCLDFHHLDPDEKEIEIGNAYREGWSLKRIFNEISKCIIVCSNCHRKIHANLIGV